MYATTEDHAFLRDRGFLTVEDGFCMNTPKGNRFILLTWEGRRLGGLAPPPPELVFWTAIGEGEDVPLVVSFADRCPTPVVAFVLAETRVWTRQ